MIFTGNSWKTDYNLVEGLTYGATVPEVGYIYSEDATIKIGTMYQELEGIELEFTDPEYSNLGGTYKKKEDVTDFVLLDEDTGNTITATGGSYYISGSEVSAPVGSDGPSIEDVARATWVDSNGNYPKSKSKKLYYDPPTEEESSSSGTDNENDDTPADVVLKYHRKSIGGDWMDVVAFTPVDSSATGYNRTWKGSFDGYTWILKSSGIIWYLEDLNVGIVDNSSSASINPWTATWGNGGEAYEEAYFSL